MVDMGLSWRHAKRVQYIKPSTDQRLQQLVTRLEAAVDRLEGSSEHLMPLIEKLSEAPPLKGDEKR